MEDEKYENILAYLKYGNIPAELSSTKSNFIAEAEKYKINRKQNLERQGKIVVKKSEREKIFYEMHQHSGRTACWERIRER